MKEKSGASRVRSGFTLIELIVVITILGVLSAVVVPNVASISPKYRLRSAARVIGAQIGWVRSMAGGTSEEFVLRYDLDEGVQQYWVILPPGPDEDPGLDLDERETMPKNWVESGVRIREIRFPDGSSESSGLVDVILDQYGNEGSHIVVLENEEETILCVKFSALIGALDYFPSDVDFEDY